MMFLNFINELPQETKSISSSFFNYSLPIIPIRALKTEKMYYPLIYELQKYFTSYFFL